MAKVKTVNYTDEQVAILRASYTGMDNGAEVAALATQLNKTPASVRAKLSQMGIYKTAEKSEDKAERITKSVLVDQIASLIDLAEHEIEGLAKSTKSALEKVLHNLR
jgi:hypothetical protein